MKTFSSWFGGAETKEKEKTKVFDEKADDGSNRAGVRDTLIIEKASQKECFEVVSEVAKYPEFLTLYERVDILSEDKNPTTGEVTRTVKYSIHIPLLLQAFIRELSYTLKVVINYGEEESHMSWDQISGPSWVSLNQGHWISRQKGEDTELGLEINIGYSFYLPQHLKNYIQTQIVRDSLNSIKKRAFEVKEKKSTS